MNVQYAIKDNEIYVIEVNPRASRTVPFVSKAQGQPFAKIAAKVMAGKSLAELGVVEPTPPKHVSVKEVVFPFSKFPGVDVILGPEMRSTGEVMGIDADFRASVCQEPDCRWGRCCRCRGMFSFRCAMRTNRRFCRSLRRSARWGFRFSRRPGRTMFCWARIFGDAGCQAVGRPAEYQGLHEKWGDPDDH